MGVCGVVGVGGCVQLRPTHLPRVSRTRTLPVPPTRPHATPPHPPQRDCSSPFHITPYEGKYPEVPSTPDALHLQKVLAGCADRGAERTLVEIDPSELQDGR